MEIVLLVHPYEKSILCLYLGFNKTLATMGLKGMKCAKKQPF
jgi:hypothetical protein